MKNIFLLLIFSLLATFAYTQAVAWELSAQPGDQTSDPATFQSSNFNNCTLTRGAGVTATTGTGSMNSSAWFSGSASTTLADAIAGNDYYEFTINTINCLFFNPTTIKIVLRSSATGPNTATLRCSSDGFTSNIGTVTVTTTSTAFTFSETISPNSSSVTYRLYGYGAAAGGGTPSAGGTMRIGSSVVASDNDLEVFATTTLLTVASVANITVTDGDAVPATTLSANVPGAVVNWSRSAENIGLAPTSGTGNVPAFTAFNPSGSPVTCTFTVSATLGSCTSVNMTFTITVNPAPCTITVDFFGNPSACNDNGTPNDPTDDFFTQNIHASFFNRPTTGSLQIVPGGDQIGTYSIPVNQIIGNSHTFNGVQLKADGTPTNIQMNFTDLPACIDAATGPTVQPCSTPPPSCDITNINFLGNPSACNDNGTPNDPTDDFFTQDLQAIFFNRPTTGSFQILPGGDEIGVYSIPVNQIIGNAHIFNNVKFKADGTPTVVTVNFTDAPACSETKTGPTIQPCSGSSCEIIGYSFANIDPCNDNGTGSDPSDDFFTVDVDVIYSNSNSGAIIVLSGTDVVMTASTAAAIGTNLTKTLTNVKLRADGQITDFTGAIQNSGGVTQCSLPGTGPSVNSCSSGQANCSITALQMLNLGSCDNNGTPNDPTDDFFTSDIKVFFVNPPTTGQLTITGSDVLSNNTFSAANVAASGSPFFISNLKFRADGLPTSFVAQFTDAPGCSAGTNVPTNIGPCSFPAPVLTCPQAVTVSCTENVPPASPASVSETHSCPGNVTIVHLGDANSNVACINKFTLTRTYKATDQCGQTATCSQTITVNDQTPPTVTCPVNVTVSCANNVPPVDLNALGVTDNCAGAIGISRTLLSETTSNQTCVNRFTITRTFRGGDACANTATCTQTITVNDQTKPTLSCPANVTVSCANNVPAASIASVTGVSDNCGGSVTVTNSPADVISNQTCANRFTLTRSYTATDACGNSSGCVQTITVNDQTPPTLTCPANLTVSCAEQVPASNPASVTGLSDNCGGTATPSFFSDAVSNQTCANRFTLTRQYRATDACGNTASCTQVITVNDQTAPTFTSVPANVTVDCYLVPGVGMATASDNCTSGATVTFLGEVKTQGICPVFYILTRTWRATDVCGNSATASQVVTVTDYNAPQFIVPPQNAIVECGPDNAAEFQAFLDNFGGAVVQDCAQITYTHEDSPVQNNSYNCGNTFRKNIRFIATDECGNSSFRDASFTVVDQTPPVFSTPPQDLSVECQSDDNGENAFIDWFDSNAGLFVEDACGGVFLEKLIIQEKTGCGATWSKTVEFRATDECGNLSKTTATFAVVDHTPPTLECAPNGNNLLSCIEDLPAADPTAISAWDCSGVTRMLKDTWTVGTGCPGYMMTVFYRYAVTDECGNESLCEQTFQVEESETPTLVCPDTIQLSCVNDIPGPVQLFAYLKTQLAGACPSGFISVTILSDSGEPQNGATHRTYAFTAKTHCGIVTSPCTVTFHATGTCNQLCTASQSDWGDPNGTVGGMSTDDALAALLTEYGPVTVGGGGHTVSAADAACVQEMLFGSGDGIFLPTGHYDCPLPAALANPDGSLNNQLAANAIALQLNIWYNLEFNDRDLGIQDIHNLPPCLVEFALLKDMGQHSTVQDLLDLVNLYLQGAAGYFPPEYPDDLNVALDNLNYFRVNCTLNAPCERPGHAVQKRDAAPGTAATLRVFPNPSTGAVTLEFWAEKDEEVMLSIADLRGVVSERHVEASKGWNSIGLSFLNLPAGIYGLTLQNETTRRSLRVVKMED